MSTTQHDTGSPKTRVPRLQVRNRLDLSAMGESRTEQSTETDRQSLSMASITDRPPSNHSHAFWTPDPASSPTPSISETSKPKSKKGVFKFLSLKEPSASAWEEFAQQQKAEAALRGNNAVGMSHKKLPPEVPRVNSKWDGMPKMAGEKRGTSSSIKRSTDSSSKTSDDHLWGTPTSSTRQSSSSKTNAGSDATRTNKSGVSTSKAQKSPSHSYFDQPSRSSSTISRPHGQANGRMAWSTRSLTPDEFGPTEWSTFSDMPVQTQRADDLDDEEPAVPGLVESANASELSLKSSMPTATESNDASPSEPRTPEHSFDIIPSDSAKRAPPPAYSPQRESSSPTERAWRQTGDTGSGMTSVPAASPPPIPSRSARRIPSADSIPSVYRYPANKVVEPSLDGVDKTLSQDPQSSSVVQQGIATHPRQASSEEDEVDELDAVDIPRFQSGSGASHTTTRPHLNCPRPSSASRSSLDSSDSTYSTPTSSASPNTTRTPFRSFSRPLPFNTVKSAPSGRPTSSVLPHSATDLASSMGVPSIVRNSTPINHRISNFVAPRFQPGRAIVKDSDLDTIAETDSLRSRRSYASTIGFDVDIPRGRNPDSDSSADRRSYASTIDMDIPRKRRGLSDMDGACDDFAEDDSENGSLRSSLDYASSNCSIDLDVPNFSVQSFNSNRSAMLSATSTPVHSSFRDDENDSGDDTETELDFAAARNHHLREEPSVRSLAPSVASATSVLSARWSKTPQERLGLGGRVRKSVAGTPWGEQINELDKRSSGSSGGTTKVVASDLDGFDRGGEKGVTASDVRKLLSVFRKG